MISVNQSLITEARNISSVISPSSYYVGTKAREAVKATLAVAAFFAVESLVFKKSVIASSSFSAFTALLLLKNIYEISFELNKTRLKIVELRNSQLNKDSPDYIQATSACKFLIGVNKNLENYFKSVRISDCGSLAILFEIAAFKTITPTNLLDINPLECTRNFSPALCIMKSILLLAVLPIAAHGLYRRSRKGAKLVHATLALSEKFLKNI